MAAGTQPALEKNVETKDQTAAPVETKPLSFKERIIATLTRIFEHNERLGVTRL